MNARYARVAGTIRPGKIAESGFQPVLDSFPRRVAEVAQTLTLSVSSTSRTVIARLLQPDETSGAQRLELLLPLVYDELRVLAHRQRMRERSNHTLSTTALIHEAYIKLVDHTQVAARGRAYFFGAAARAMRQILVDYARRRGRKKRAGPQQVSALAGEAHNPDDFAVDVLALHDALEQLAAIDERSARVIECRYFGGLSTEETAAALDISARTVKRDWTIARAWLFRKLQGQTAD